MLKIPPQDGQQTESPKISMNNPAASGGVSNSNFLSMLTPQGGNLTLEKIKILGELGNLAFKT